MKKLYFQVFTLFITVSSFGQTVVFLEDFSGAPQYTLPEMPEQIVSTTDYFTRTDGTNIASPINFTDGDTYFAAQDIDTAPMVSPATMFFNDIDITGFTNLTFGVALAEHDAGDGNEDWDDSDFVHFEYQIDNSGIWKNLVWVENDGSTFNTAPQRDTDFDGVGDGAVLTNEFFQDFEFLIPESGTLIDIRVTFGGLTAADEDIAIEALYLVNDFNLFPGINITSPTDSQMFPAGTTSVDIQYAVTNSPPGTVNIDVNGVVTTGVSPTGPFNIATTDGETYNVEIVAFLSDGTPVDDWFISFSVDTPLGLDDADTESFKIYPNPTSLDFVNIESKNNETIKATVFDILGKQIISSPVTNNKLDISNLNTGIYILRLDQNTATVTKKLVIK